MHKIALHDWRPASPHKALSTRRPAAAAPNRCFSAGGQRALCWRSMWVCTERRNSARSGGEASGGQRHAGRSEEDDRKRQLVSGRRGWQAVFVSAHARFDRQPISTLAPRPRLLSLPPHPPPSRPARPPSSAPPAHPSPTRITRALAHATSLPSCATPLAATSLSSSRRIHSPRPSQH